MYQCLRDVSESFVDRVDKEPMASRFIEALILLVIYHKCSILEMFCSDYYKEKHLLKILLQNLAVDKSYSDINNQKFLCHFEASVGEIVTMLISRSHVSEWIFAVPLLHLITKQCEPYATLKSIDWSHDAEL